jgi:pyruvate/2-oxoglutarate dehydrogenase complex dihydrolipoamide dehydrogenase (E3) component
MEEVFDVIVIGAGSGGLTVSLSMNALGFKVLLIDKSDNSIGGDCLNEGCVPSKSLIHLAKLLHQTRKAEKLGLSVSGTVDLQAVTNYIRGKQDNIRSHENASYLIKQGLHVVLGEASFYSSSGVTVSGKVYKGKKIVIATGSRPKKLHIPGIEHVTYFDNESIFHLNKLPQHMVVVGGGPVGVEIGQALSRLGVRVCIVQKGKTLLKNDPAGITEVLVEQLRREGVNIMLKSEVVSFDASRLALIKRGDETVHVECDAVFAAVGREIELERLALDKANIEFSDGKIKLDKKFRTSNRDIFVCGDAVGDLKFSHAAEYHGRIIVNNLLSPLKKKIDEGELSWVTFTDPQVATFGLTADQLSKSKISFETLETTFENDDGAVVNDYQYGKSVLYVKKNFFGKRKILGGSMIAPQAGEMIQELILLRNAGLSINALFDKIYPYPVASRVNQKIVVEYKQKRLTNFIKRILKISFTLFR